MLFVCLINVYVWLIYLALFFSQEFKIHLHKFQGTLVIFSGLDQILVKLRA